MGYAEASLAGGDLLLAGATRRSAFVLGPRTTSGELPLWRRRWFLATHCSCSPDACFTRSVSGTIVSTGTRTAGAETVATAAEKAIMIAGDVLLVRILSGATIISQ